MQEESKEKSKDASFESLRILSERWKNGTFSEIIDDWKWIFGYSARYKGAIVFYTILGILSTSLGLVGSVAGKYLIDEKMKKRRTEAVAERALPNGETGNV